MGHQCSMGVKGLIECNMRNIFLKKSYTKCLGETSLRNFYKKSKLSVCLNLIYNSLRCYKVWFCCMSKHGTRGNVPEYIKTEVLTTCFFSYIIGVELVFLPYFMRDFWRKIFFKLNMWKYWIICVLQLFVVQSVTKKWKVPLIWNKKHFPSFLKRFQLPEFVSDEFIQQIISKEIDVIFLRQTEHAFFEAGE